MADLSAINAGDAHLYERDFCAWLDRQAALLHSGQHGALDATNLAEEIEAMGRSERQAVRSNLIVLLAHLLKAQTRPERISNSWRSTIREHRRHLRLAFEDSPSLRQNARGVLDRCFAEARLEAADETGLPVESFPAHCPFPFDEILTPGFLPRPDGPHDGSGGA